MEAYMHIGSLFNGLMLYPISLTGKSTMEEESSSPSYGQDTVSISSEARAAYEFSLAATQKNEREQTEDVGDDPTKVFSDYLNKAKGNVTDSSGGGSAAEQIEKLKNKLVTLQQKLVNTAADDTLPDEVKSSRVQVINAEIEQVMGQIAELMGQLMEEQNAA